MALRWLSMVVLSAALIGACGDDDKGGEKDAGTDASTAGKGGSGGGGGSGGMPAVAIMCGTKTCEPPEISLPDGGLMIGGMTISPALLASFGFGPENCCAGKNSDVCGVTQSTLIMDGTCLERNQEGRPATEDECPSATASIMGFSFPQAGCCRFDNKCGIDLGILGVGCLETSEANRIQMMGGGAGAMVDASIPMVSPKACVYAQTGSDGGTEDAGR